MNFLTWFFLVASLVGFAVSTYNTYDAVLDLRALNVAQIKLDGRRMIARANLRTQAFRALELLLFITIAVMALAGADPVIRRAVSSSGLTVIALLIIGNSISDRFVKSRLLHRIRLEVSNAKSDGS